MRTNTPKRGKWFRGRCPEMTPKGPQEAAAVARLPPASPAAALGLALSFQWEIF